MQQHNVSIHNLRENIFFYLLIVTAIFFPFSEALVSISIALLFLQALALRLWHHPSVITRSWKTVVFPLSVFGIYLIGVLFTNDITFAFYELRKVVFWIVLPLAVFLSPKLPDKRIYIVFLSFIISVITASFIITGKLILHDFFQEEGFRNFSFVSHIRFSFQVVLALILLAWFIIRNKNLNFNSYRYLLIACFLWLIYFLILLKSLLGIISFLGTFIISLIYFAGKFKNTTWKKLLLIFILFMVLLPAIFIGNVLNDFYNFKPVDPVRVETKTLSGNFYHHDFENGARENGYLVNVYVCDEELRNEWNKRSDIKYDDLLNGFPLSSTLIRYMTSQGYRKDSVGVSQLTSDDIKMIEEGVTNYKFRNRFFSIYPRIYETVWELDHYFRTGDPNNKSLAQRIEYVKASLILIKENPLFGIGTGNWVLKYNEAYDKMETQLAKEKRGPSHNQYLNYMVKFGIVGFIIILLAILIPVFREGHHRNFVFVLFLISIALANFGDSNLETHMGLSFFTFFYSLFLWNSTSDMKTSILKK